MAKKAFVQLGIILSMQETDFEFTDQTQAMEFAKAVQKAIVKTMHKSLNLPEGAEEINPPVPAFSIVGFPAGSDPEETGFLLGTISNEFKHRKKKGATPATEPPATEQENSPTLAEENEPDIPATINALQEMNAAIKKPPMKFNKKR